MSNKDDGINFTDNILYRIETILKHSMNQEDLSNTTRDLISIIKPYMSDRLNEMYKEGRGSDYNSSLHRVRYSMLTLFDCNALPRARVKKENRHYTQMLDGGSKSVAGKIDLYYIMNKYLEFRNQINDQAQKENYQNPMVKLHNIINVGWAILSPYISEEDHEEWVQAKELTKDNAYEGKNAKIDLTSKIMDREGLQWNEADIDEMEYRSPEEMIKSLKKGDY
ncbi:MAG: hypothetical protein ACLFVB_08625 [Thermoplasmata archaeon]